MTRNQKIALGCGGAGCLGLIVVAVAGVLLYFFYQRTSPSRDFNSNVYTNRNTNTNDNTDIDSNDNSNSSNTSSSSASSLSDDDKHKLYQAAYMTGDGELIQRVNVKLGLLNDDFTPGENYEQFVTEHVTWVFRNTAFIRTINTPEKARAYVDQNFPN